MTASVRSFYTAPMADERGLASAVDAAQSILATPAADQARRIEHAFAECARATAVAMARLDPASRAHVEEVAGGLAIFAGAGSPCTQALGVGLSGPVSPRDLDVIEAHLCPDGVGRLQIELSPFADPSLPTLLGKRGYRVGEWQLVWTRAVSDTVAAPLLASDPALRVRPMRKGEEDLAVRVVLAGFLESDSVPEEAMALMRPSAYADGYELFLALLGDEPIGGGTLTHHARVAFVNGSGVRPAFRRRGAQGALLRARLARARELGCEVVCSATLPGTASRRNMERHGFHVAYPKLAMIKDLEACPPKTTAAI